jgi:type I restriction enzyme M protein
VAKRVEADLHESWVLKFEGDLSALSLEAFAHYVCVWRKDGLSEKEAEEVADRASEFYTFNIPREFLWDEITKSVRDLPERLATAISEIAKLNRELDGVINRVDFLEFARNQENRELLRQLVELFNRYDLGGEEVSPDVLGFFLRNLRENP